MSMTSKIIALIQEHVMDYEVSTSAAKGKENEADGLKSLRRTKSIEYQLREAQYYQLQYETQAAGSRLSAFKLAEAFMDDLDSDEKSTVNDLTKKLK